MRLGFLRLAGGAVYALSRSDCDRKNLANSIVEAVTRAKQHQAAGNDTAATGAAMEAALLAGDSLGNGLAARIAFVGIMNDL